jgi:hypothetical protein
MIKYGFGEFVLSDESDISVSARRQKAQRKSAWAEHSVGSVGDAGTPARHSSSWVRLLSTRPFLLPYDYIEELSKLMGQVDPLPWPVAEAVIKKELGTKYRGAFRRKFDRTAIASASLSEVHRAKLKDGTTGGVKIQRDGNQE